MNEALKKVEAKVHAFRKEGPAFIKPPFSPSYDGTVTHALVEDTYDHLVYQPI